jgi:hypothetical protein
MPTETASQWIRRLYRPGVRELGLKTLAQEIAKHPRRDPADPTPDADIFALAERCEAAAQRFYVTSAAYAVAEFAEPHDQAAEDEAERLQVVAQDELGEATLPLVWARATTFAGLLAKARALKCAFPEDARIAIEDALQDNGIFDVEAPSLSLARDLIALAGEDA